MQKTGFAPYASEIDADYSIRPTENDRSGVNVDGFVSYFRDRMARLRDIIGSQRIGIAGMVPNIEALRNCANGREVTIVGMVSNKIVTKNGNIMVVLDDETGEYKIIFMNGSSQKAKLLFEKAKRIVNDEVIAVNGKMSSPFIIANEIVWPDVPIKERKKVEEDVAIAFISDIQIGSKKFMEKNFVNFIKWLNGEYGERHDLAGKIKYIVFGGDVVDGIGVYPSQDRDLAIPDIYAQYKLFTDMIAGHPGLHPHLHNTWQPRRGADGRASAKAPEGAAGRPEGGQHTHASESQLPHAPRGRRSRLPRRLAGLHHKVHTRPQLR